MSTHLEERELVDLIFETVEPAAAAAARRHLQGCKACKAKLKRLRAKFAQLDQTRTEVIATEDLIARTIAVATGKAPTLEATAQPAQEKREEPHDETPELRIVEWSEKPEQQQAAIPQDILEKPRRDVLEFGRFFWISAAAAAAVAVMIAIPMFKNDKAGRVALADKRAVSAVFEPQEEVKQRKADQFDVASARDSDGDGFMTADRLSDEKVAANKSAPPPPAVNSPAPRGEIAAAEKPALKVAERATAAGAAMPAKRSASLDEQRSAGMLAKAKDAPAPATTTAPAAPAAPIVAAAPVAQPQALAMRSRSAEIASGTPASDVSVSAAPPKIEFTEQVVPFILPMMSGTWILQQNVRVRASATDDGVKMDVSNHGALPVVFELHPPRGTNVLLAIPLEVGQTTNFFQKTK